MTAASSNPTANARISSERRSQIDVVRPTGVPGVEFFHYRLSSCLAPQLPDAYAITVVDSGSGCVRYRGRNYDVAGSSVLLSKPDELFAWTSIDTPIEARALYIDASLFELQLASVRDARAVEFRRFCVADDEAADRIGAVVSEIAGDSRPIRLSEALSRLLARLGDRWVTECGKAGENAGPVCPGFIRRARQHLVDNARSKVTLADLEKVTGRGRFEIIRGFKHAVGTTPHEFLVHTRVKNARRLLRDGHRPVDVAGWVGFFDQSHLNRHFKRLLGVTPAQYRKA